MRLSLPVWYVLQPNGEFSEKIRTLRTHLIRTFFQRGGRSILLTSAWRGEGKSSVALNLAVALAELGHQVLICDGDVRGHGLARKLLDPTQQDGDAHPVLFPGIRLMLMAPAEVADLSAYLGSSANINKIFAKFAGSAMVLIDGPPLAESGDAFALSRLVDGVLVVASGTRFRGVAEGNLCEDLRDFGARILGVVAVP